MKKLVLGLAFALTLGSAQAQTTLRAITYAPPGKYEDSMVIFKMWIDRVNEAGKGKLKIDHIGGPEVFPVADQVNAVSKGLADIVMTFTVHAALVPEIDTTGLSDLTPAEERKAGYMDILDKAHEKINIKMIGRTATDSGFYIFSKDPIRKLDDFKGVKIRSHSGYDPLFKAVGAVPVGMNISEIYSGLEHGVVRAAPYPLYVYDMGLQSVTKYVLADAFWRSHTTFTLMNRKKFMSLPPDQQKLLMDKQLEVEHEMPKVLADMKAKETAKLEKAGMVFVHLSPDEANKWRRLANDSRFNAISPKIDPAVLAKIKSIIVKP
jgi:TRAP-type transport system periplasmic protein